MTKTLIRRKRTIIATEDTPLYARELGEFMGWGRGIVSRHISEGYQFEYGRTTTPRHYRRWLSRQVFKQNREIIEQNQAERQQLERELLELK